MGSGTGGTVMNRAPYQGPWGSGQRFQRLPRVPDRHRRVAPCGALAQRMPQQGECLDTQLELGFAQREITRPGE